MKIFCGVKVVEQKIKEITARDLYDWQVRGEDFQLIDVRELIEYEEVNIGAQLVPLSGILDYADSISREKKVVIHCKMGGRSAKAIRQLEDRWGFQNLYNLKGGIVAYISEVQMPLGSR